MGGRETYSGQWLCEKRKNSTDGKLSAKTARMSQVSSFDSIQPTSAAWQLPLQGTQATCKKKHVEHVVSCHTTSWVSVSNQSLASL